jgi:hypothetical protein
MRKVMLRKTFRICGRRHRARSRSRIRGKITTTISMAVEAAAAAAAARMDSTPIVSYETWSKSY